MYSQPYSTVQAKGNSTVLSKDNSPVDPKSEMNAVHSEAKLTEVDNL